MEKNTIDVLARRLRILRYVEGLSLYEMASMFNTGTTSWHNYETGKSVPPIDILLNISNHFMISLDTLFTDPLPPPPEPDISLRFDVEKEVQLLKAFRSMDTYAQGKVVAMAMALAGMEG